MKGQQKITKIHLADKTDEECTILGIVSNEADYKLSQLLNQKLKLALKNAKTLDIKGDNETSVSFSRFSDNSKSPEFFFNLISNKSDKNYLLKKLKNIDYFFQVHSIEGKYNSQLLTASLRDTDGITAVFRLDPREIKEKNLVYLTL
jgi:hypothetical protein